MASVFGDDQRDRLADEAHAADRKPVAERHAQRRAADALEERHGRRALPAGRGHIVAGQDVENAGKLFRLLDVDPDDPRMRAVGAEKMPGDLPWKFMIRGVTPLTGDQALVFPAPPELMFRQADTSIFNCDNLQPRCGGKVEASPGRVKHPESFSIHAVLVSRFTLSLKTIPANAPRPGL